MKRKAPSQDPDGEMSPSKSQNGQFVIGKAMEDEPELPQPEHAGVVPKVPFRWLLVGPSKSGKTNLARWALDKYYKDPKGNPRKSFFGKIHLLSPTANIDYTWSDLPGLEPQNRHTMPTAQLLENILNNAKRKIQGTISDTVPPLKQHELRRRKEKAEPFLIIMDDAIAESKLINSPMFLKLFYQIRHYGGSVMLMAQAYKKIPRPARLQASHVSVFPSMTSEIERLYEDHGPKELNKKEFVGMVRYATEPREGDQFPFLHVESYAPINERYRRNFIEQLHIESDTPQEEQVERPSHQAGTDEHKQPT